MRKLRMTIELDFRDLGRLAANCEVVKDGIMIKISKPILSGVNKLTAKTTEEYVTFSLDSSDERSKEFAWSDTSKSDAPLSAGFTG